MPVCDWPAGAVPTADPLRSTAGGGDRSVAIRAPRYAGLTAAKGMSMSVTEQVRLRGIRAAALASAFALLTLAGCGSGGAASTGPADSTGSGPTGTAAASAAAQSSPVPSVAPSAAPSAAPSTGGQTLDGEIPPGREIAEGGGGPMQYTFREEWRRALAEARKWRSGAYLITAAGAMVNDEGVPSRWALDFIDRADADAVLKVDVDPWGAITQTREVTGDGVSSFVDQYTNGNPLRHHR